MQPALHDQLYAQLLTFPDAAVLDRLASLGVTYVVVHTDLYSPEAWRTLAPRLDRARDRLSLAHEDGSGRVYSLRRAAERAAGYARIFAR